jgi:hypothetical protein
MKEPLGGKWRYFTRNAFMSQPFTAAMQWRPETSGFAAIDLLCGRRKPINLISHPLLSVAQDTKPRSHHKMSFLGDLRGLSEQSERVRETFWKAAKK